MKRNIALMMTVLIVLISVSSWSPLRLNAQEGHSMDGAEQEPYQLKLSTKPNSVQADEPFQLGLEFSESDGETPITEFDEVHTKLLHLIVVSEDLSQFFHLHPDYTSEGQFALANLVLPETENYVVFADFTPTGDEQQVIRATLSTDDASARVPDLVVSDRAFVTGQLRITMNLASILRARDEVTVSFSVSDAKTGDPISTLDEYLGAAGHLVVLDETALDYIHTHPTGDHDMSGMTIQYGPKVEFMTEFPEAGLYALWLQVQYEGEIYTAPFVVNVDESA